LVHGLHADLHDRASMIADFKRHTRAVIDGIPKGRLLVYDVGQGWEPLCAFLGMSVPDTPFPRANVRADTEALLAQARNADARSMKTARDN
jgi:hypothetical protein